LNALLNNRGSNNIAVGSQAGSNLTSGSNNIHIGNLGAAGESNTIRIGKTGTQTRTFIQGIRGATVANGVGVIVGTTGQLGTVVSSAKFKEAIKPMDKASEAILASRRQEGFDCRPMTCWLRFLKLQRVIHEFAVSLVVTSLLSETVLSSGVSITTGDEGSDPNNSNG
jgi:hypothetical protein